MLPPSSAKSDFEPDRAGSFFSDCSSRLKPTKFATATIKVLCHPSRPTDFFYHPDSGWSRDQPQPGSFSQRQREAAEREPGNEVEAGRTGNLSKKIFIFIGCDLEAEVNRNERRKVKCFGGRFEFFPSAPLSCINLLHRTNTVSNIRMKPILC